ncbi:nuclear transport factor 2 family protein [Zooshikella harenae]|uniref:Nuclear transport factor 2 family protein n=1 Tax=Zooshikella harenae TaxID=2827238 RepID=A0ABS5Z753_9GAMM|nr:nuclear transport factor 2 family protein [Zooshikella harenae]MBU2709880.1 nuclear transport factor 2 family protein [Zooshikella harenae]
MNLENYLQQFLTHFQQLDANNLAPISSLYTEDVVFSDPLGTHLGIDQLTAYFQSMYYEITYLHFEFKPAWLAPPDHVTQPWTMTFKHRRLPQRQISVEGVSLLHFNTTGLVTHHQDFFDLGALLYEQLPVLGKLIRYIKKKAAA